MGLFDVNLIDQGRVVQIIVPDTSIALNKSSLGTGYLICDGCVLTAYHVIKNCGDEGIKCRSIGNYNQGRKERIAATLVWSNIELDLALLEVPQDFYVNKAPLLNIQKLDFSQEIDCLAYGFPFYRKENLEENISYKPDVAQGWIRPLEPINDDGELLIDIKGASPEIMENWKGMSGAAVFNKTYGYLIGVILNGNREFKGSQLKAIALETVITKDPSFSEAIESKFRKNLAVIDPGQSVAQKVFDLKSLITQLESRKTENVFSSQEMEYELNKLNAELARLHTYWTTGELDKLPETQLLKLLVDIEKTNEEIFKEAWQKFNGIKKNKFPLNLQKANKVFEYLFDRENPENLIHFLELLCHLLDNGHHQEYKMQLIKLAKACLGKELCLNFKASSSRVNSQETVIAPSGNPVLLIKLKNHSSPKASFRIYEMTAWLIDDSYAYQKRHQSIDKKKNDQTESPGFYGDKLADSIPIEVEAGNFEVQAQTIIQKLSVIITDLLNDLEERKSSSKKPEIVFCVPVQLLTLDFHNIPLFEYFTLGYEYSVSVSCLERYEEKQSLHKFRNMWKQRWTVIENNLDEVCSSYLEIYDSDSVDITCPRNLYLWLSQKEASRDREQRVVGLGFYQPYEKLHTVFENLLINGLPIVFWPHLPLNELRVESLDKVLKNNFKEIRTAIQSYRKASKDDASISFLLDNPYLGPPEIDYQ